MKVFLSYYAQLHIQTQISTHLSISGLKVWLSAPSCHQARLNVSQNVRLCGMAAHHVSIYRYTPLPTEQSLVLEPLLFLKRGIRSPRRAQVCFRIPPPSMG